MLVIHKNDALLKGHTCIIGCIKVLCVADELREVACKI